MLNDKCRFFTPACAPERHSEHQKRGRDDKTLQPMCVLKPHNASVAESPAGPDTPAQPNDLVAAFGTEVWSIDREERQVCEDRSFRKLIIATDSCLKNPAGVGHTLRTV